MPNGRSGGFYLKCPAFEQLLKQHAGETVVGKTLKDTVTAFDLLRILSEWKRDDVPIEEQDGSWYIVHFPEWVTVDGESPLFHCFRTAHVEFLKKWAKEHSKNDGTV